MGRQQIEQACEAAGVLLVAVAAFLTAFELGLALVGVALLAAGNLPNRQPSNDDEAATSRRQGGR